MYVQRTRKSKHANAMSGRNGGISHLEETLLHTLSCMLMHAIYIHTYTSIITHTSIYTNCTHLSFFRLLHMLVHPNTQPRHCVKYPHIAVFILFLGGRGGLGVRAMIAKQRQ